MPAAFLIYNLINNLFQVGGRENWARGLVGEASFKKTKLCQTPRAFFHFFHLLSISFYSLRSYILCYLRVTSCDE